MSSTAALFVRWRVRLSYPLTLIVLLLAQPNRRSILMGAIVCAIGLVVRAWAAGYLHKQQVLTMTGPYAYSRNPLYLGSAIITLGAAIATHSWPSAVLLCGYFALVYTVVMRREEEELRLHHGPAFDEYSRAVPLFFPRLLPAKSASRDAGSFSFAQYKKNREYQAAIGFLVLLAVLLLIWRLQLPWSGHA